MPPGRELALANAVAAALLQTVAFVALTSSSWSMQAVGAALQWLPAPMLAAGLATAVVFAWWRATARGRDATAFALTWRIVLLAFLLYPLCLAGWLLLTALADQIWAAQPATLAQTWSELPMVVLLVWGFAAALGGLPALAIEYPLCRRYLRRLASASTSTP